MDNDELRDTIEEINLLRKYPKESVSYMAEHIDEVVEGDSKGFIAGAFDHVLPIEGEKVLEDGMMSGL